ncbi:MAG: hypothetical protein N3A68_07420 [Bacteroidia bacterium]|jgi:hypothetical protein|nr:hypothetical protein [Bacteroidia bacterium]
MHRIEGALTYIGRVLLSTTPDERLSLIRSQRLIRPLHLYVAYQIYSRFNVSPEAILLEAKLPLKNVDVLVVEKVGSQALPVMAISIRSQLASIKKNFTNNVNQLQGELLALRSYHPTLSVGLLYLLSRKDYTTGEDCVEYYTKQIPKKLLPLIGVGGFARDRFDAALILVADWNEKGEPQQVGVPALSFLEAYNEENFWHEVSLLIGKSAIYSPYTLAVLMKDEEQRKFLN